MQGCGRARLACPRASALAATTLAAEGSTCWLAARGAARAMLAVGCWRRLGVVPRPAPASAASLCWQQTPRRVSADDNIQTNQQIW